MPRAKNFVSWDISSFAWDGVRKRNSPFLKKGGSFLRKVYDSYRTTFLATVVPSSYTVRSM